MKKLLIFTVIGILMVAGSALADSINVRPVVPPLNNLGTLQSFFDGTLVPIQPSNLGINVQTDQNPHAIFKPSFLPLGDIVSLMFYEGAGFANVNAFGIYKFGSPAVQLTIFQGPVSPPASQLVSWFGSDIWLGVISGPPTIAGFGTNFGYFLKSGDGNTYYSEDSLNPGGLAQMLIYQDKSFADEWWVCMEDLNRFAGASDSDFEDMIIRTSEVTVPEPTALILMGVGLAGAGLYRRLRKPN